MVTFHGASKYYTCETCTIYFFYLEWRFEKHLEVHKEGVKPSKHNKTGQNCPYDEVGCIFKYKGNIWVSKNRYENVKVLESDIDTNDIDQSNTDDK